jgi:hypothetical protein
MLEKIGVHSFESDSSYPKNFRLQELLNLSPPLSELELINYNTLACKNIVTQNLSLSWVRSL